MLPSCRIAPQLDDCRSEEGQQRDHVEQRKEPASLSQPCRVLIVYPTLASPGGDGSVFDRSSKLRAGHQTQTLVGQVGERAAVDLLLLLELFDRRLQILERLGVGRR